MMPEKNSLHPDTIRDGLQTEYVGRKVVVFAEVTSTNDICGQYANNADNNGMVIFAEKQTAGRGRGGNKWLSNAADSVMCSILLIDSGINCEELSLTAAVATADAIGINARIKWPNDIIVNQKKAAGILVETKEFINHTAQVIGVGINCRQKEFSAELASIATSIDIETKSTCDRTIIARRLLTSMEHWLEVCRISCDQVIERFKQLSTQLGHRISVVYNGKVFSGNCIGLDPDKGLILQLDSGARRFFEASLTSIAK